MPTPRRPPTNLPLPDAGAGHAPNYRVQGTTSTEPDQPPATAALLQALEDLTTAIAELAPSLAAIARHLYLNGPAE